MVTKVIIKRNTYYDSVSLMSISAKANELPEVEQAFIGMATEMNKGILRNVHLLTSEVESAKPGDLFIVIQGRDDNVNEKSLSLIEQLFHKQTKSNSSYQAQYATLLSAKENIPEINLAVISVNGSYAVREAKIALEAGLNVMLFSDNVNIDDELALKKLASTKKLLMMGPDCGTAIINNTGLCFANKVRSGSIGIIGASGTGSQEVSVRIHEFGGGISQLIGTGGRDLSEKIGGITMINAIKMLNSDQQTKVIVLISKPPSPTVEEKVLAEIENCSKPVIVYFIGGKEDKVTNAGGIFANGSKEAALKAVLLTGIREENIDLHPLNWPLIEEVRAKLLPTQRYIRGLFCGGTLCDEAIEAALVKYPAVYSNIQKDPSYRLCDINQSIQHTFLDFGDDEFTNGKAHPMIDPSTRIERLLKEATDPEVGVILMDFIIGFGAHADPVGVTLQAIKQAKEIASSAGRHLEILGYVLGTDLDKPNLAEQVDKLSSVGVTIASSSTNAGLLAREFVWKGEN